MRADRADTSCRVRKGGLLRRGPGGCEMVHGGHAALASAHRAVTVLKAPRKSCAGGLMLTRFLCCGLRNLVIATSGSFR